jgi:hypothetical protein
MRLFSKCFLAVVLIATPAMAAQDLPYQGSPSNNASSTITVTNTFQSLYLAQRRGGCTIQNNGTHNMYVFAGPIASALLTNTIILAAGQTYQCNVGVTALTDQISITGTSTDPFFANQW